ncbi:hypothetical protein K432DRAFT_275938, partial [Lepidopterella palustris CBS 459.81]
GFVFLLLSPLGSGKSLTAGDVSEWIKRPLFSLGSGELGIGCDVAEHRMQSSFELAQAWNTILLLDKTDISLAKRSPGNVERNAFVSILLRLPEYHRRILFLTTTESTEFDVAFQSRIRFTYSVSLPNRPNKRGAVWRNELVSANGGTLPSGVTDTDTETFGKGFEINGREIENLIRISLSISKD